MFDLPVTYAWFFTLITVPTSMQHTSLSPDGKLLLIVGDDPEGILVDSRSGKVC